MNFCLRSGAAAYFGECFSWDPHLYTAGGGQVPPSVCPGNECGGCASLTGSPDDSCSNGLLGDCRRTGWLYCSTVDSLACTVGPVAGTTEVCDGRDNDCDGSTDDGFNVGSSCSNNRPGACAASGTIACSGGTGVCSAPANAGPLATTPQRSVAPNGSGDWDCNGTVTPSGTYGVSPFYEASQFSCDNDNVCAAYAASQGSCPFTVWTACPGWQCGDNLRYYACHDVGNGCEMNRCCQNGVCHNWCDVGYQVLCQ